MGRRPGPGDNQGQGRRGTWGRIPSMFVTGDAGGDQVSVRVLCVAHQRQVQADGLVLRHVHAAECGSARFIIRTDRFTGREQALAEALRLGG